MGEVNRIGIMVCVAIDATVPDFLYEELLLSYETAGK